MNLHSTPRTSADHLPVPITPFQPNLTRMRRRLFVGLLVIVAPLLFAGGSSLTAEQVSLRRLAMATTGYTFDVFGWELAALSGKVQALVTQPARALPEQARPPFVIDYLERAEQIRKLDNEIAERVSEGEAVDSAALVTTQQQIDALRQQQTADRSTVEQIIEQQVTAELVAAGFNLGAVALPPVYFDFVEPPKKLIVSPRDHIATVYGQMVAAELSRAQVEQVEQSIQNADNLSAYITNIGGLGAYPTMVIDSASLSWVLSTVAHEWTHNYLTFFPLGFHYGITSDNIIINETVAEIVGNEIGERVLRRFYPSEAPPPAQEPATENAPMATAATFDFGAEMRQTRLVVDQLLALGQIEQAERYMELRRQYFVENGYPLRVLNQAYFAFHGSYGTGAASTSPLGPKLEALRTRVPNTKTFLQIVRSFTTPADVDRALAAWPQPDESPP